MKSYRILSHSYRLVNRCVSTKDVVLKKQFANKLTTEEFFEIDKQPENTCPMIDPVQTRIEKQMEELEAVEKISLPTLHWSDRCDKCSNDEIYKKSLNQAEEAKSTAESLREQLEEAKEYLEVLRSDCEKLRAHGLEIKKLIWSIPEVEDLTILREQMVDLIGSAPEPEFSYKKYSKLFPEGDRVSKFEVESFDSCENEDCPFHSRLLSEMEDMAKLLPTLCIWEEDCSDAMDNYDKISEWVVYLGEKAIEVIDDEGAVQNLKDKNDIDAFIKEYQKDFDHSYLKNWSKIQLNDLVSSYEDIEKKVKSLLMDFENNTNLEYILLREILNKLKLYSHEIGETSCQEQLEQHQKLTRQMSDELFPKIESIKEIIEPYADYKLKLSKPQMFSYYANVSAACSVMLDHQLLKFYNSYKTFSVESV